MTTQTSGDHAASRARTSKHSAKPAKKSRPKSHRAAREAFTKVEREAPPEHDHEAAFLDSEAIPKDKLNVRDVEHAAQAVFNVHEALKGLNDALYQAGRGKHIGCLKLYCLLDLFERDLYSALDFLRPYTLIIPDEG